MNANSEKGNMWRSVEAKERQKYEVEKASPNEFPAAVTELIEKGFNYSLDRKKFLTIMGASLSMAGINCAKQPAEKIVPYVFRPPEAQPGIPVHYATARVNHQGVLPILVKAREGKPIKIDGHDEHPVSKGAMTADGFAGIWELYDPDRLKTSAEKTSADFSDIDTATAIAKAVEIVKGASNVRVLSRASYSPSEKKAKSSFLRARGSRTQVVYDAGGNQAQLFAGEAKSYGSAIIPQYRFDKADLIVSIGADFLGTWITPEVYTKQHSSRRNPDKNMNRLVVAETMMSLTGANADTRFPISAGTHLVFALGLAKQLLSGSAYANNASVKKAVAPYTAEKTAAITGVDATQIKSIAKELKKKKGKSLVVAGGTNTLDGDLGSIQVVANLINSILGNDGKTIEHNVPLLEKGDFSSPAELAKLIDDMKNGNVDVLILDRANPVFDLPAESGIREAIKNVKNVIAIADHKDESASEANLVIAASHYLESWNDGYSSGVYSVAQPVIRPLFDTQSVGEIWLQLAGLDSNYYNFIKDDNAGSYLTGSLNIAFEKALSDGFFVARRGGSSSSRKFKAGALSSIKAPTEANSGLTLTLYESVQIGDGINGNNSYRHELPDPITKICWENFVAVSKADAQSNGWRLGDLLEVSREGRSIKAPIYIQPGLKDGSVALAIGYGHESIGSVGDGVGANAWTLAGFSKNGSTFDGLSVEIKKVESGYRTATTQRHHDMHGRGLVRHAPLSDYKENPKAGSIEHDLHLPGRGLYPVHDYSILAEGKGTYKWGMAIDLSKCTGCSACVISCYSENNIPVTGKDEVWRGREMSWMRIDRYFEGEIENPTAHFAPVMCQHCENAPCENVCPTNATQHSPEGLNDMAYNRCIGTRYCSDNCPFKVRRFNWFEQWEGKIADPAQYALNPDVTVRGRGVIEKCSFCVQRINEQRQMAKSEGRKIEEKDLKTACQQGCPADAIVFGDIGNKETMARAQWDLERGYRMLDEVNVHPRVKYLTRIINQG
ncbi:MAG: 4Fe-4S dicluster domain-containing protein [Leptospirales bacterium]